MTKSTFAIVGFVGTTIAYTLTRRGHDVVIFEKGPDYSYPHTEQFSEETLYLYKNPKYTLPKDLKNHTLSGQYYEEIEKERFMLVGGSATNWAGITIRMTANDFKTRTQFGYGDDWPITYDEIEPYYCKAEHLLGVSGTDADNPFAPPRSQPHPLPPFELSYDDVVLSERLKKHNILLHTTPQARTRKPFDGRDACVNFGTCRFCPIGARYSPNHHLNRAIETGLCKIHKNVSVRRIVIDKSRVAKTIVYQSNEGQQEMEHEAKVIILAPGGIESTRLLLLSKDNNHPDGIGNSEGFVGKNVTFHHLWRGLLGYNYKDILFPGRIGAITGQSHQFINSPTRGKHGAVKVEFSSNKGFNNVPNIWGSRSEIVNYLKQKVNWRRIVLHAESAPSPQKYITLSHKRDRFGDPFAHIHYESSDFDYKTYEYCSGIFEKFATATNAEKRFFATFEHFDSGAHHMGGCKMGNDRNDSVVNKFGEIHGHPNLFVVGGSTFVGTSGAANPTLTIVAMSLMTSDYLLHRVLK